MAEGLKALANEPGGVIGQAYGSKLEVANRLYAEGKYFEAASIQGEVIGDVAQMAMGAVGIAKLAYGVTQAAAKALVGEIRFATAASMEVNSALAAAGLSDVPVAQRLLLLQVVRDTGRLSEAKGIVYGYERMKNLGYELRPESLKYGSNNGLDLVFQHAETGKFAILEAKNGTGLGALDTYSGLRQGSSGYNMSRLEEYIKSGGANAEFAASLRSELINGNLESFASFRRGDKLVQFDLSNYLGSANFRTQPQMYTVVPRR